MEATFFNDLILEVMLYHFCPILFSASESVGAAHIQEVRIMPKHEYQELGITGANLAAAYHCRAECLCSTMRFTSDLTGIMFF